jgi:hypothetical protein
VYDPYHYDQQGFESPLILIKPKKIKIEREREEEKQKRN